jgi:hypothetical protein
MYNKIGLNIYPHIQENQIYFKVNINEYPNEFYHQQDSQSALSANITDIEEH